MVIRAAHTNSAARPAFTLLEVLLASAVGVLLMGALYVAVDVQLRHAQAARDIVERSTLARAILTRMGRDISASLAPTPPPPSSSKGGGSSAGGTGGAASGGAASAAGTAANSGSSTAASSTSTTNTNSSTSSSANNQVTINLMVQGTTTQLTLSVSRVPRDPNQVTPDAGNNANGNANNGVTLGESDLRFVTYWLAGGNDSPLGLARQELSQVTGANALSSLPPNISDEASYVIADEVKSLTFSYFDGSAWQDTWDGTQVGSDGVTPLGPPQAIAITIGIASSTGALGADGQPVLKMYRHVVSIPTANGTTAASSTSTPTSNP